MNFYFNKPVVLGAGDWEATAPKLNPVVVLLLAGFVVVAATDAVGVPNPNAGGAVDVGCAAAVVGTAPKDNPIIYRRLIGIF